MGIQRTTQDSARIAGALTGAGLVALMGMGVAYAVVATLYTTSFLLTWKAGGAHAGTAPAASQRKLERASPLRELKQGLVYVFNTPLLLAVMCLAFILNMTAFPLLNGLLPYVAKEIYLGNQTVLGYMVAGASFGALMGSLLVSRNGTALPAARVVVVFSVMWYVMMFVFSRMETPAAGIAALMFAGFAQSFSQVPMGFILLRNTDADYRGRVMGIRMLMINGNIPGLLIGPADRELWLSGDRRDLLRDRHQLHAAHRREVARAAMALGVSGEQALTRRQKVGFMSNCARYLTAGSL